MVGDAERLAGRRELVDPVRPELVVLIGGQVLELVDDDLALLAPACR